MVPLIDIIFLLLVFFIYVMLSMTINRGIEVQLPEAATAEVQKENCAVLAIDKTRGLTIDKKPVAWAQLIAVLDERRRQSDEDMLLIRADRTVPYDLVFKALDSARAAGYRDVSLMAEAAP